VLRNRVTQITTTRPHFYYGAQQQNCVALPLTRRKQLKDLHVQRRFLFDDFVEINAYFTLYMHRERICIKCANNKIDQRVKCCGAEFGSAHDISNHGHASSSG
jgi:hypothetical protein